MHIHILGICGTFMGGVAQLARSMGYAVSGSDMHVYPPMSTQLEQAGIQIMEGYSAEHIASCNAGKSPDLVIIGNALSRGNEAVEAVLNQGLPYISGPQWLSEVVLRDRWVLAVAGTHGKTTTSSILAWLLESAGLKPGFLIGGVPKNFGVSACLGETPFFVIEADEYDTAFFDKRSKFVHYRPKTLVLNNLEFDHADIFEDLEQIKKQFHHLLRIVPGMGRVIVNSVDENLADVISKGCWTPTEGFGDKTDSIPAKWQSNPIASDGTQFELFDNQQSIGNVSWKMLGQHNVQNAVAAIAAAQHVGVLPAQAVAALAEFAGVNRRMEIYAQVNNVTIYDDFAHHPTAIHTTINGLRNSITSGRIIVVLELRSNTMRMGIHDDKLAASVALADKVWISIPSGTDLTQIESEKVTISDSLDNIVQNVMHFVRADDHILVMSNGGFGGIHAKLMTQLKGMNA